MTDQDWTFVRTPHEEWAKAVDNMAKTLAYVWANRLIFYKALLPVSPTCRDWNCAIGQEADDALTAFNGFFQQGGRSERRL